MKLAAVSAAAVLAFAMVAAPAIAAPPSEAGWRTPDPQNVLVIDTNKGRIIAELSPEAAPAHAERVRELAKAHFYDGLSFFRVIDSFMAQTGDPQNTGAGGSDKPNLVGEFTFRRGVADSAFAPLPKIGAAETGFVGALPVTSQPSALAALTADGKVAAWGNFCPGVLGMARANDPDSANSQFFFMRQHYPTLDKTYTAFGRALSGLDVIRAIKAGEPVVEPQDKMLTVRVLAEMPAAERPSVQVMDTHTPAFLALVDKRRAEQGGAFNICDLDIPVRIK
jgi:peptidylprolyl isomerase